MYCVTCELCVILQGTEIRHMDMHAVGCNLGISICNMCHYRKILMYPNTVKVCNIFCLSLHIFPCIPPELKYQ